MKAPKIAMGSILLVSSFMAAVPTLAQGPSGIGLVDLQSIMQQSPGYHEARTTFQQEVEAYQTELEGLRATRDSMVQEFDRQQAILSPTNREEKATEIRQFDQRLQDRVQQVTQQSNQRERELLAPLEERVQAIIEGVRAERNLAVIFDLNATGVLSADRRLDLTQVILQRLQQASPPK